MSVAWCAVAFVIGYALGAANEESATVEKLVAEGYRRSDAKAIARGPWPLNPRDMGREE